jgi:Protein of unknown function (DUF2800)
MEERNFMITATPIRCSSLPLAFTCPGSLRGDGPAVDMVNDASADGTAVHAGLASVVRGMDAEAAHELMLSEHPACNRGEVTPLFWAGVKMWNQISKWMPTPQVEGEMRTEVLSGHVDAQSVGESEAAILDWKSGRKDHDYRNQGFGYAWLRLALQPDMERVTIHFAWLRTCELESYTVDRGRAEAWYQQLKDEVVNWDGKYHAGPHCTFCPRRASCPAIIALVRQDVAMFADGGKTFELSRCTGPELCGHFRKIKMLQRFLEAAERNARAEIGHRGEVDDGEGGVIHMVATKGNREIAPLAAWPILSARLTDQEIAGVVEIGVGRLEDAIQAKAPKGKGAAAIRDVFAELAGAGAVTRQPGVKLVDERKK